MMHTLTMQAHSDQESKPEDSLFEVEANNNEKRYYIDPPVPPDIK